MSTFPVERTVKEGRNNKRWGDEVTDEGRHLLITRRGEIRREEVAA